MRVFVGILALAMFALVTAQDDAPNDDTGPEGIIQVPVGDDGKPPVEKCFNTSSCVECHSKAGQCMEDGRKCCIQARPHMKCFPRNDTCGEDSKCIVSGGKCMEDKCCFFTTDNSIDMPAKELCFPVNGSCDETCTNKGGECKEDKCCFAPMPPPHERCLPMNGTCGEKCTEHGGECKEDKCCFGPKPPHERCLSMNGTCDEKCTEKGGECKEDKCCFDPKPPGERCMSMNGTCDEKCTQKGGECKENKCCFAPMPPPHERCLSMNGTCGEKCTEKGGECKEDKCCFGPMPPSVRCFPVMEGTCDARCTQRGGECKENKCCMDTRRGHDDDDDDDDDDSREKENSREKHQGGNGGHFGPGKDREEDNSRERDDDDTSGKNDDKEHGKGRQMDGVFKEFDGMKYRCTRLKCDRAKGMSHCTERGGVCYEGKCCFKPTKNEAQSKCEKERRRMNAEQNTTVLREHLNCTSTGAFLSKCQSDRCQCLNASSGRPVGQPMRMNPRDGINCDTVQKQTKAALLNITTKLSARRFSSFSKADLDNIVEKLITKIESKSKSKVRNIRPFEGSLMVEIELGLCEIDCAVTANTTDLFSIGEQLVTQIEQGDILVEIGGETFVASNAIITNITSTAALQAMEEEMHEQEKEMKLIVILAVVIAAIVVICSIAVACIFYRRAKRANSNEKSTYFRDASDNGIENNVYMKA